ncbi:MAG: fluoride efflux transporter CrcB [Verrucomicrobia bacterium]|nr:fluoride efflux transporter CrcB [Verrucomicrobiota bacterium]
MKTQFLAWLCIAIGGGFGALGRFAIGEWIQARAMGDFPAGTLLVNLSGCLVFGLLYGWLGSGISQQLRGLLFTGLLSGFTTFSTFGFEAVNLLQRGQQGIALLYLAASIVGGLLAVWLGLTIGGGGIGKAEG